MLGVVGHVAVAWRAEFWGSLEHPGGLSILLLRMALDS